MTVSRVVKNSGYVNTETRKLIEAVIKELDYRPNEIARSLHRSSTNNILLVVPDIENPFFAEMIKGTTTVLRQYGYQSIFADSDGEIGNEKAIADRALSRIVDGVILYCPRAEAAYFDFLSARIPLLVVDRRIASHAVDHIYIDNKPSAQAAVDYLIANGHRDIGLIGGPQNVLANLRRKSGYLASLKAHDIPVTDQYMFFCGFEFEDGVSAFDYFWRMERRPSAYFATNDLMALGFIQQAHEKGLAIPGDFSVVGFDNIAMSRLISPALTTVDNPRRDMGALAAFRMLRKLDPTVEVPQFEMTNRMVIRGSVRNIA
ncbi:MAG: transcriptional regulator, LacI family [Proteobacteria bacterium]|nr:transcriptional regulator, LacI family [Pseudomonadota bacterium]